MKIPMSSQPKLKTYTCAIFCLVATISSSFSIDFEPSEGFVAGSGVEDRSDFEITGPVLISADTAYRGDQALLIPASNPAIEVLYQPKDLPSEGVRFITLAFNPAVEASSLVESSVHAWGSDLGFLRQADGRIAVVALGAEQAPASHAEPFVEEAHTILSTTARWGEDGRSDRWLTFVIRQDLSTGTWDLFIDGKLRAIDHPLNTDSADNLTLFGSEIADVYVDNIAVVVHNPLFQDDDSDGIPTAEEIVRGSNPYFNDRDAVRGVDGVTNIEAFLNKSRGNITPTAAGQSHSTLYVDNATGSDANTGTFSYATSNDGPKASIKAAMAAARSGDTIVILPGTGLYDEGSRDAHGKRLTIKPVEPITIR